jgi:hypothetical protein
MPCHELKSSRIQVTPQLCENKLLPKMESSFGVPQYLPESNIFVLSTLFLTWPERKSMMIRL